jgi:hypothetical protein
MNSTNIAASSAGSPTRRETPATSSHAILRSLYAVVRKFCPTWEWQVAVEFASRRRAGTRPDVTLSPHRPRPRTGAPPSSTSNKSGADQRVKRGSPPASRDLGSPLTSPVKIQCRASRTNDGHYTAHSS